MFDWSVVSLAHYLYTRVSLFIVHFIFNESLLLYTHTQGFTDVCPSSINLFWENEKPSLLTMAFLWHGLGASCEARCLHMLPLITAHRSNSSKETRLVPLKEGTSLVRHEESWVCWENIKPSDWLNAAQAPPFLMPSLATHNAPNTGWYRPFKVRETSILLMELRIFLWR